VERLTHGVVLLLDSEGEATVGAVNAEEDHGYVLGGQDGAPRCAGGPRSPPGGGRFSLGINMLEIQSMIIQLSMLRLS
jgi:hypothetical protein